MAAWLDQNRVRSTRLRRKKIVVEEEDTSNNTFKKIKSRIDDIHRVLLSTIVVMLIIWLVHLHPATHDGENRNDYYQSKDILEKLDMIFQRLDAIENHMIQVRHESNEQRKAESFDTQQVLGEDVKAIEVTDGKEQIDICVKTDWIQYNNILNQPLCKEDELRLNLQSEHDEELTRTEVEITSCPINVDYVAIEIKKEELSEMLPVFCSNIVNQILRLTSDGMIIMESDRNVLDENVIKIFDELFANGFDFDELNEIIKVKFAISNHEFCKKLQITGVNKENEIDLKVMIDRV